jgi:transketolase
VPRRALGDDEIALTRENLGWNARALRDPEGHLRQGWDAKERGAAAESDWNDRFDAYAKAYPELKPPSSSVAWPASCRRLVGEADAFIKSVVEKGETIASRKASQNALNGFGPLLPELIGGSADLAGSNLTLWKGCKGVSKGDGGNYIYYGVREFGMSAIMNGIALHGGFIPYGATFLMFSEYARNALRMAALMKVPSIFVYTHDSIGLGEDGPTHQPVEQIPTLRMIPNMSVWRPCDAVESAVSWKLAIERKGTPFCLIFSRQNLPHMPRTPTQLADIARGGYVLRDCAGTPDAIIIATGSEVELAVKAAEAMSRQGDPRRLHAVDRRLRPSGRGLPRIRAAQGRDRACRGRSRR